MVFSQRRLRSKGRNSRTTEMELKLSMSLGGRMSQILMIRSLLMRRRIMISRRVRRARMRLTKMFLQILMAQSFLVSLWRTRYTSPQEPEPTMPKLVNLGPKSMGAIRILSAALFGGGCIYDNNSSIVPSRQIQYMEPKNNNPSKVVHLVQEDQVDKRKVIVVLEKANLQIALLKRKDNHVLLNGDDHADYIKNKLHRDPAEFRPDITHQCLLTLLDSPLNKAGKLEVYVTTSSNQVIKINSATRIPRTFKRFSSLMAQLLKKMSIRAEESSETLLKIVTSPVTNHLPPESLKLALSTQGKLIKIQDFIKEKDFKEPIVFLVGAVAHGNPTMEVDYYQESFCISRYAMSASNCLGRLLTAFEFLWGIN